MIVCDRCGEKIADTSFVETRDKVEWAPYIYSKATTGIRRKIDLCRNCSRELDDYIKKAESYFMVNKDNPKNIFDKIKYWSD